MINKKQLTVLILLSGTTILGSATIVQKTGGSQYTNLEVLPRNISSKELLGIMTDDLDDGLGVSCGFCHAAAAGGHGLDFASDARPEKQIARAMMRMTINLNKKYFKVRRPLLGAPTLTITCTTCHNGQPFPDVGLK